MEPDVWKNQKKSDKMGVLSPDPVDNCVDSVDFHMSHAVNIHIWHAVYVRCCNKFRGRGERDSERPGGCLKANLTR